MTFIITYIKRERRKWGLTQRQVAKLVGVSSSAHISALERGRTRPSAEVLLAFQFLFGMTAAQMFPQMSERAQKKVLRGAAVILAVLATDPTLRAQRTKTLLDQLSSGALMS